ncbi:hypothetical protein Taro_002131 [Colocasia esculenta]|uniref:Uncharacterized protein n=1 Tax=Colocasia esculenta TaxID=4460 RepID=A0A843TMM3_COLES|nr:hypothetical protein [Colocasia esculenta]
MPPPPLPGWTAAGPSPSRRHRRRPASPPPPLLWLLLALAAPAPAATALLPPLLLFTCRQLPPWPLPLAALRGESPLALLLLSLAVRCFAAAAVAGPHLSRRRSALLALPAGRKKGEGGRETLLLLALFRTELNRESQTEKRKGEIERKRKKGRLKCKPPGRCTNLPAMATSPSTIKGGGVPKPWGGFFGREKTRARLREETARQFRKRVCKAALKNIVQGTI